MQSVYVLLVLGICGPMPQSQARPRDKNHRGLYDDVKITPFVDEKIDDTDVELGQNWKNLGNDDESFDKYNKIYDLYHKQKAGTVAESGKNDGEAGDNNTVDSKDSDSVDTSRLPIEGGTEAEGHDRRKSDGGDGKKHRHGNGKSRAYRVHPKKHTQHSEDLLKEDKSVNTNKEIKNELNSDNLPDEREDLFKFLDEDPKFKKNVGVITDWKVRDTTTDSAPIDDSNNNNLESENLEKKADEDTNDQDSVENDVDFDDDESVEDNHDDDDDAENEKEKDLSSEMYDDAYDYYDGEEESSYSSSEAEANKDYYTETPYDWFKQFEKTYGKTETSKTDEKHDTEIESKTDNPKDFDKYYYVNDEPVNDLSEEKSKKLVDIPESDKADTMDSTLEPSTSPNPPTEKKEWKPMVTQPAQAEKEKNPEYVTYIESRPVEACDVDWDCPPGRYCKFGLCICGQPNFCEGHNKPVCGSDGTVYPSHCELHRTACVKGVHIRLMEMESCQESSEDKDSVDSESTVQDEAQALKQETTEQDTAVKSDPEETKEIDKTDAAELDKTVNDSEEKTDKKIELKDDGLSLVAATAVKQAVNVKIANKLKIDDEKDKTIEFDSGEKSAEYEVDYSDSLEAESEESIEEPVEETVESQDQDVSEASESVEKKGKRFVERTESAENSFLSNDSEESIDAEEETNSIGQVSEERDSIGRDSAEEDSIGGESKEVESNSKEEDPSLVPLFCTPEKYLEFKANVLQYHCLFFEEPNCDRQTQQDKHKLAAVMFNYFDHNYNGRVEKVELWKMQLRENMDEISTLCTLLDLVTFDELGVRDEELSPDEFIQAFDIPDLLEHRLEIVPLLVTIGNGLEVKCDVTKSHEVIWRRNGMDLALLSFPGISVLGDGSLYIESVGADLVGNITCHDRNKPSVKQVHMLTVQKPPHVTVSPKSSDHKDHSDVELRCHAKGLPRPVVEWRFNDRTVEQGEKYYIHTYDNSLTVHDVDYLQDSGVFTCVAHNNAGTSQASATITIHNPNDTDIQEFTSSEESFIVFHDDGYSMYEPSKCLSQRHVKPDFGNFYFIPDELDEAPSMCQKGIPCIWGSSVNVENRFVYVTQPRQNRVLVIDVKDTLNPNQVIPTDRMPVSLYYLPHLDEVWVLCWNGEEDGGSKTVLVIRDAGKNVQHHTIHTQPIGNRFDMVQDVFLPPATELHAPYRYGYTVHNGQQGLFKLDLVEKKYLKAIDFTMYQCVPKAVAFVPLGGMVMVKCVTSVSSGNTEILLQMDYITDVVVSNTTMYGTPYVTPDSRHVVIVDEHTGQIKVFTVTPNGEITDEFDLTVGSPVNSVTFVKASFSQGYDLYMTSTEAQALFSVSLLNGKIDIIKGVGAPDSDLFLPWFQTKRPLVSGDVFSQFLSTTAMSRTVIFNARHRSIQCDFINIDNPLVIEYARLYN